MIWRIGDKLDFFEQLDWVREHEFQEVSFWSCPGQPGKPPSPKASAARRSFSEGGWQGFDLVSAEPADFSRLKAALRDFEDVDIHAPSAPWSDLDTGLASPDAAVRQRSLDTLRKLLERSAECGTKVLTLHVTNTNACPAWLAQADTFARECGVKIGLELTSDYNLVTAPSLTNTGLTVDVGHMQFKDGAGYRAYGSLGALIERVGGRVFHVHVHDYDGVHDHIAIGQGRIDFAEIMSALAKIRYAGSLCLELNPDLVPPQGILKSRDALKTMEKA
jgi:sugar phosphate isomerase/epimerase